jgi:hypothetical protein
LKYYVKYYDATMKYPKDEKKPGFSYPESIFFSEYNPDVTYVRYFPSVADAHAYEKEFRIMGKVHSRTYSIIKDSTKSLVDTTAASGHNTTKENNAMNMFSTPTTTTPATSVTVKKNVPAPAPVPPATFDISLTGLSARTVSRIRKVLENSGVAEVLPVAQSIRKQTGDTGEFNSGLSVKTDYNGFIRFVNK